MYHVKELYEKYQETLSLSLIAGEGGLSRPVRLPEAHRPGLGLAGHLKGYVNQRILVLGSVEASYLRDLDEEVRKERIQGILTPKTPMVVIAGRVGPPRELIQFCDEK
jgi:HPr kinase/phosphorylase